MPIKKMNELHIACFLFDWFDKGQIHERPAAIGFGRSAEGDCFVFGKTFLIERHAPCRLQIAIGNLQRLLAFGPAREPCGRGLRPFCYRPSGPQDKKAIPMSDIDR